MRQRELPAGLGARVPPAIDDCLATARWLIEHAQDEFGTSWFSIGGESAGAHLSGAAGGSESHYVDLVK
ncbi:alpha/beta hydrolase fold domain-containing protein [Pseudomonas violetae]|uniref:alpha/beta hydrolase fold domain-containing protein n=1 Tax=Pseudomonas violetae TaxID=2915813 RepID=UPI003D1351D4